MRYTQYIDDGDSKVVKALNDMQVYGVDDDGNVVLLNKTECANHLINRLRKRVCKFGINWTKKGFEEREVKRNEEKTKREKREEAAR